MNVNEVKFQDKIQVIQIKILVTEAKYHNKILVNEVKFLGKLQGIMVKFHVKFQVI